MITNNVQLGTLDIELDNINGIENKPFKLNGKISIGISINAEIISIIKPLLEKAVAFNSNKLVGKSRIQKELDECELLELRVRKARLLKQLRYLEK